jgi:DNA-binding protein
MSLSKRISTAVKKKHTLKNNLIIDIEERLVRYLSETYPGRIHDKRICDIEELVFPPEINLFQDTGFQGYQSPGVTIYQPKKKPKGQELTEAEKAETKSISSIRILVEHIISGVEWSKISFAIRKHSLLTRLWKLPADYTISECGFVISL